ncbi:MAG: DUF4435 domain-containing protein [Vampirovibrionales bacterium]
MSQNNQDQNTIKLRLPSSNYVEGYSDAISFNIENPLVILGANGSGKTRFSIRIEWLGRSFPIENTPLLTAIRIEAKKNLKLLDTKYTDLDLTRLQTSLTNEFSDEVTSVDGKYTELISFMFAKDAAICKKHYDDNTSPNEKEELFSAKVSRLWHELLPHRKLDFTENMFRLTTIDEDSYLGAEMSDGEHTILYFIMRILSAPEGAVFIIDEPEQHLNKAVVYKLWDILEREQSTCFFIYLTHDLDFALSRSTDQYLWVKGFKKIRLPDNRLPVWDYEVLSLEDEGYKELPKPLLLELVGSRKAILFVEGTKGSLDYLIYKAIYKDHHVIPCGGCAEVIQATKAKRQYTKLNTITAFGLIDRDYRTEDEIETLKQKGIFTLNVAEVENLLIVPEVLSQLAEKWDIDNGAEKAQESIKAFFNTMKKKLIQKALESEVNHRLKTHSIPDTKEKIENFGTTLAKEFSTEKLNARFKELENRFEVDEYRAILAVFNEKQLLGKVEEAFELKTGGYLRRIEHILKNAKPEDTKIVDAIHKYMPEIPIA